MTFIEAVRTGKLIKRKFWANFLSVQQCDCGSSIAKRKHVECPDPALMFPDYVDPKLTAEDVLAEDWITEE